MNVLFLDLDGPAWPDMTIRYHPDNRRPYPGDPTIAGKFSYWRMCENFRNLWVHLHNVFDFKTVISSSWRNVLTTPEHMSDVFDTNGLPLMLHDDWRTSNDVDDTQPHSHTWHRGHFKCHRHYQIKKWLENHPEVDNWICFDDRGSGESLYKLKDTDNDTFANNVVLVDEDHGFDSRSISKTLFIMKGWE